MMNRESKLLFDLSYDVRMRYKYMPMYINKGDDLFDIAITLKKELIFIIWPRNKFVLSLSDIKISLNEAIKFYKKELIMASEYERLCPGQGENDVDV